MHRWNQERLFVSLRRLRAGRVLAWVQAHWNVHLGERARHELDGIKLALSRRSWWRQLVKAIQTGSGQTPAATQTAIRGKAIMGGVAIALLAGALLGASIRPSSGVVCLTPEVGWVGVPEKKP